MSDEIRTGIPKRAEKGQGARRLACDHYKVCLDHAAKNNWDGFDCKGCGYATKQASELKPETLKAPALLCAECGEKECLGGSPYCASCMAIRGNKARAAKAKDKGTEEPKKGKDTQGHPTGKKPLSEADTALTIEFGKHASILREVENLADKEIRPVECQVIYMLKKQLTREEEVRAS